MRPPAARTPIRVAAGGPEITIRGGNTQAVYGDRTQSDEGFKPGLASTVSRCWAFDIRQLTDVSHCNLQHHLSCKWQFNIRYGGTVTYNTPSLTSTRFLTVFEVAAIMRVSKQTVYRLVQSGDMEAIRVGGSYRIPEHVVRPHAPAPRQP